ncbi:MULTISPECIES: phosphoribosylanthranilate isomerase [Eubacterium]|jgi:phosphoribosylanthranilate isomerase|uniref:phosphoribosylanthranilate isomerase n=1 Tax=Eubacterium TaxID=1730 RepID=UPI000E51F83E|nr:MULTISPECIES: phosphoribosylanthranilate isomerase [Eubacterium]MBS5619736.1 phosphoribosylanthranilate isomerase [Eubacterium sp.]MEE0715824.1 phosphoribosylanthranilate isomerase [Eubacterium sp.]RGF51971.1 phosphoribosylanthranilate isomerase [Eubacterium sp. AF36-5BH]
MIVKICGITDVEETEYLNENNVDMAGMVLYFPKSKRNITLEKAKEIMASLNENIKKVAVVVSPSIEQVKSIENAGFDFVQIHKDLPDGLFNETLIDVLKAFNVNDLEELGKYKNIENIKGYVFDAPTYGSGETFDWSLLNNIKRDDKLFILAGGLNGDNVRDGIKAVQPDGVDVSSGVENDNGVGKSREKIREFVMAAKVI